MTFIEKLAAYIYQTNPELRNVIVIFPNRRPAAFLYRALGALSGKPIFAPECFSIRDFIFSYSSFRQTDNISLLFKLYDIYRETGNNENSWEFEHFISSGEMMLADFNDIDHSMVNARQLFSNLDEAKAIEMWNPAKGELSGTEKQYLEFFKKLETYYHAFREKLSAESMAFDGMAYRTVAESILNGKILPDNNKTYVFAGFNALNKAETIVIDHFVRHGNVKLFWDADLSYVQDEKQEAGFFLRKNFQIWPPADDHTFETSLLETSKKINIIGAPLHLSQSKYAGLIAENLFLSDTSSVNSTVIVPADESTLPQLLESIPECIQQVNITMGYSLSHSSVFSITNALIKLHINAQNQFVRKKSYRFYYSDLINFFRHSLFDTILESSASVTGKIFSDSLLLSNKLFYSQDELEIMLKNTFDKANFERIIRYFNQAEQPEILGGYCTRLCSEISAGIGEDDSLTQLMCKRMSQAVDHINSYVGKAGFPITFHGFSLLFQRIISGIQIPFEGEPLGGLQVMGFLETRCLDFKNVIFTNFNEGFMPAGSRRMLTFIPFDLRRSFEMNVPGHKDAIYAYYFLRLIQRAENIWILYNTEPDPVSGKEESRFIRQIDYELFPASKNKWSVNKSVLKIPALEVPVIQHPGIVKSSQILDKINTFHKNGYSASGLSNYIECPFRFYLSRILQVKEVPNSIDDSVSMNVLGDIIHESLKTIYSSTLNRKADQIFFSDALKRIQSVLDLAFHNHYKGGDMSRGKNLIIKQVAARMLTNVIKADQRNSDQYPVIPLFLEHEFEFTINQNDNKYRLRGTFDRVDNVNGNLRISDYKTGMIDSLTLLKKDQPENELNFSELNKQQLQLLFYLLISRNCSQLSQFRNTEAGIISLRKYSAGFIPLQYSKSSSSIPDSTIQGFKEFIISIIDEILDPKTPFIPTTNTKKCTFCQFSTICKYFQPFSKDDNDE